MSLRYLSTGSIFHDFLKKKIKDFALSKLLNSPETPQTSITAT